MMAEDLHLVMLPWLAFGHLIPFLQLSIVLARAGFRISFLSTPRNIQRLPKPPQDLMAQISFVELPFPHVDGLDDGSEATSDVPAGGIGLLMKAYDLLSHPFESFVAEHSPDFIIHDIFACWTADVARRHGVPCVFFSIYSACMLAFFRLTDCMSVNELRERMEASQYALTSSSICFPSTIKLLPYEALHYCNVFLTPDASGVSLAQRALSTIQGCEALVLRSCEEYEGEYVDLLRKHPKPVIPVGFLLPEKRGTAAISEEWERIFRWLDGKPPRSVVFVAFGSECKLSRKEIDEIALGLELSDLDFLWALSMAHWSKDESDVFRRRSMGRGIVNLGWAPQLEILAHPAVGGCLCHAGWSSLVEAVGNGLPLVFLPFLSVQRIDARVAVDKGLGLEVERDEEGKFNKEAIARSLRRAMVGEEREHLLLRSREMMAIFGDHQLNDKYVSGFVNFLKTKH